MVAPGMSIPALRLMSYIANHPMNAGRRFDSVAQLVKWQLQSRLAPEGVIHTWVNGSKFRVRNGETGLTGNIYTGLQEYREMGYLLHVLRPDDLFVDVGANVGSYAILACAAVGAKGVCFEPVPATYARLVDNIRLNQAEARARCLNIGIGRTSDVIEFSSDMDVCNRALAAGEQRDDAVRVQIAALDTVLKDEWPTLMKIDVEGYETAVLDGADETLRKPSLHSVIMEINGSGSKYDFDESRIFERMSDYGFGMYSYDPLRRQLERLHEKAAGMDNTLFIRDEATVRERLQGAPAFEIHGKRF